jgi:hypothetical protein
MAERRGLSAFVRRGKSGDFETRNLSFPMFGPRVKPLSHLPGFCCFQNLLHFIRLISLYPTSTFLLIQFATFSSLSCGSYQTLSWSSHIATLYG